MAFTCREQSRGNENVGPCDMTRTEMVCDNGRVYGHVTGICDGETVNTRYVHQAITPIDWDTLRAARERAGWAVT